MSDLSDPTAGHPPNDLADLAQAVADGTSVDWESARSTRGDDPRLRALELIAAIARSSSDSSDAAPKLEPLPDGTTVPRQWNTLRLEKVLGRGSFGTVFRARDLLLDRDVALKVLHQRAGPVVGRLLEEGRRLARIKHPNIVDVICVDEHEELLGLRMELLSGTTLAARARTEGSWKEDEVIDAGVQLCDALATMHEAGVIHRDVKARNVMRTDEGRAVLMDLGAGARIDPGDPDATAGIVGTPLHLAPEVLEGKPATPASDLYGLGVLLFHLVSGRYPVEGTSLGEIQSRVRAGRFTSLRDVVPTVSEGLARVVARSLAPDPADRFADAAEMRAALSALRRDDGAAEAERPGRLPHPLTRFVGRGDLLREVRTLLIDAGVVTLTGPGGTGKTRAAIEVAHVAMEGFPGGVWFTDLSVVLDDGLVPQAVLEAFEEGGASADSPLDALLRVLPEEPVLLVLDGCEHVARGATDLSRQLLASKPACRILATSREPLRVPGARTYPVPPLDVPSKDDLEDPERLSAIESVRLFLDRARSADARFALTNETAPAVGRICRLADGIPLALELTAVQLAVHPVTEIAREMESRRLEIGEGVQTPTARHQTLRAVIQWSYDLLSQSEQALLRGLSVFVGGWIVSSARDVCAGTEIDARDLESLHYQLVAKSLITSSGEVEPVTGCVRYEMLDTIAEFAREEAEARGEAKGIRERHREHFRSLTVEAERRKPNVPPWSSRLDQEQGNLRRALLWSLDAGDLESAMVMAGNQTGYWHHRCRYDESRKVYRTLLAHPDAASHPALRAVIQWAAAVGASKQGDNDQARALFLAAVPTLREVGDQKHLGLALEGLGVLALGNQRFDEARRYFEETLEIRKQAGMSAGVIQILNNLGVLANETGDLPRARDLFAECIDRSSDLPGSRTHHYARTNLAEILLLENRLDEARSHLETSLELLREDGNPFLEGMCKTKLGYVDHLQGENVTARRRHEDALGLLFEIGDGRAAPQAFVHLALVAESTGDEALAVRCLAASRNFLDRGGVDFTALPERGIDAALTRLRDTLGADAFEREWAAGYDADPASLIGTRS